VDKGCPKIPGAKTGETFTFVIPAAMKGAVGTLKEGQQVTVTYQAGQDGAYALSAVK
jgi:cold shock CspA family protein